MMKMFPWLGGIVLVGMLVPLVPACDSVDAAFDCDAICNRYADCFDSTYDTSACEARCRSHSADDTDYRRIADQCEACIDDRACTSAVFNCSVQCATVVP